MFIISPVYAESNIPDKPLNGIYDPNHYLSDSVTTKLAEVNSKSDTQIGVYIIDTLDGDSVENRANEIARAWKIGYADTNKGALIAIAIKDRKFRIEASNELSTMLTDSKARHILDGSKSYMRKGDYDSAVTYMIDEIYESVRPKTAEEIKEEQEYAEKTQYYGNKIFQVLFGSALVLIGFKLITMLASAGVEAWDNRVFRKRSKYDYVGPDKLTPKDDDFVDNNTWTVERLTKFRDDDWLNRSQHSYRGSDKLYPGQLHFKMNP